MIYHVLPESEPFSESRGGAIARWAANVLGEGQEVIVCPSADASYGFNDKRVLALRRFGNYKTVLWPSGKLPWATQKRVLFPPFREMVSSLSPGEMVWVHNRPQYAALLAEPLTRRGVSVVLHMHNSHLLHSSMAQLRDLRFVSVVFCSGYLRDEAERRWPKSLPRTRVIHNGANARLFYRDPNKQNPIPRVVFTGRLVPEKGVHVLVDAMRLLEEWNIPAECRIVGADGFGPGMGGSYSKKLRRNAPRNVTFTGYLTGEDLAREVRSADIYCCPSIWNDPFPLAPLEAMACAVPVVASAVGGIPEALADGGGVLVAHSDPRALADALRRLIVDHETRGALGHAAFCISSRRFQWQSVRGEYASAVEEMGSRLC
jgi:spore coat protein SA